MEVHKDAKCAVNKINNSADALYPSWELNSCSSVEFDAWWKARFRDLPDSSTALQVLFKGWDNWTVHSDDETHRFMVQTIKDINMQVIEGNLSILSVVAHSAFFFNDDGCGECCEKLQREHRGSLL